MTPLGNEVDGQAQEFTMESGCILSEQWKYT